MFSKDGQPFYTPRTGRMQSAQLPAVTAPVARQSAQAATHTVRTVPPSYHLSQPGSSGHCSTGDWTSRGRKITIGTHSWILPAENDLPFMIFGRNGPQKRYPNSLLLIGACLAENPQGIGSSEVTQWMAQIYPEKSAAMANQGNLTRHTLSLYRDDFVKHMRPPKKYPLWFLRNPEAFAQSFGDIYNRRPNATRGKSKNTEVSTMPYPVSSHPQRSTLMPSSTACTALTTQAPSTLSQLLPLRTAPAQIPLPPPGMPEPWEQMLNTPWPPTPELARYLPPEWR